MASFTYSSPAGRINQLKGEILAHSIPVEVLGITGMQRQIPKNKGKTVVYRRFRPYGALATNESTKNRWGVDPLAAILTEGVTPTADTMVPDNITVTLNQYGCLYQLSDQTDDTYEDDVPEEMKKQCGERVGLIRELVRYGVVKAIGNVFYPGGVGSRATVINKISLGVLQKVSRNLQANHAKRVTGILAPSVNVATKPVEASYLVFCHTDCESDLRALSGWKNVAEYGNRKPIHEQEIGSVENFRFITSPELAPYLNAGAAVGVSGLVAASTNVDVYPFIVCGEDAWGQVALRGADAMEPTYLPPGEKSKSDPLGQRGFVGAKFYFNCTALNEGWMAVIEAGVTNLVT
jgi:N4-gp56 family major capsid protein